MIGDYLSVDGRTYTVAFPSKEQMKIAPKIDPKKEGRWFVFKCKDCQHKPKQDIFITEKNIRMMIETKTLKPNGFI